MLFWWLCATVTVAQETARVEQVALHSKYYDFERPVFIFTPVGYDEFTETDYDVMYVFDAQDRSKFDLAHSLLDFTGSEDPDERRNFIVVGVCSPYIPEKNHYRNLDYLPMPIHDTEGRYKGNSRDMKLFVKEELMPYIDSHYRTSGRTVGIGHSLSASFVLDSMVSDELFDDYIAISPNLGYDEYRLADDLINYPFKSMTAPRFLYLSMGNEITGSSWPEFWKTGWERVSSFMTNSVVPDNYVVSVKSFPGYSHNYGYLFSLKEALTEYMKFSTSVIVGRVDSATHPVHIELKGDNLGDEIYIVGNQEALGNWNPRKVKMNKIDDNTCAIDLELHLPAYFKFTRGSWDSQAILKNADPGNLMISHPDKASKSYMLYGWSDGFVNN